MLGVVVKDVVVIVGKVAASAKDKLPDPSVCKILPLTGAVAGKVKV